MAHIERRSDTTGKRRIGLITSQAFSLINFRGALIRRFVAEGHQVFAFAPDHTERTRSDLLDIGAVPVDFVLKRATIAPVGDLQSLISLAAAIARARLDVSISYFIKPVIYGSLAAAACGVKRRYALIEGAGLTLANNPNSKWTRKILNGVVRLLCRIALRLNRKVFFVNNDDVELFTSERLISANKAAMLGAIGVDLEAFPFTAPVLEPVTFILVARLLTEKGVHEFVLAARRLKQRYPLTKFWLVGGTDENPSSITSAQLELWRKEGIIHCPGQVADVRHYLAQSSVFVLPSYYREGVPRSSQEAMAMGRPVITTNCVGCRETVQPGRNGFLIQPQNPIELEAAMVRFVQDPDLIVQMGLESRRMAEADFDERQFADKFFKQLDGLGVASKATVGEAALGASLGEPGAQ